MEEDEEDIESFSDSDSDADDDFVMQPRASKGGKSSSDASKRPSESDDTDEHLLPVPKKRRTAMPKQHARRDHIFNAAPPMVITFAEGQIVKLRVHSDLSCVVAIAYLYFFSFADN